MNITDEILENPIVKTIKNSFLYNHKKKKPERKIEIVGNAVENVKKNYLLRKQMENMRELKIQ